MKMFISAICYPIEFILTIVIVVSAIATVFGGIANFGSKLPSREDIKYFFVCLFIWVGSSVVLSVVEFILNTWGIPWQ